MVKILNTATIWLSVTSSIQRTFFLLYLQVRNNISKYEKCRKFVKFQLRSGDDNFLKIC